MLICNVDTHEIFNLDNVEYITCDKWESYGWVVYCKTIGQNHKYVIAAQCENEGIAKKIVENIYHRMTFGSGNYAFTMADFKKEIEEEKKCTLVNVADIPSIGGK